MCKINFPPVLFHFFGEVETASSFLLLTIINKSHGINMHSLLFHSGRKSVFLLHGLQLLMVLHLS